MNGRRESGRSGFPARQSFARGGIWPPRIRSATALQGREATEASLTHGSLRLPEPAWPRGLALARRFPLGFGVALAVEPGRDGQVAADRAHEADKPAVEQAKNLLPRRRFARN